MNPLRATLAILALVILLPAPAGASSSDVFRTDGGSLRLVTTGLAGPDGVVRGALEIALEPGWKTYWREPGSSGVPPQIDVSRSLNVLSAELHFPAPEWHEDSYGAWAGYGGSVSLPVTFAISTPDRYSLIEASLFLGICEAICIPVQASLSVEPGSDPDGAGDRQFVEAAFARLPAPADAHFGIVEASVSGEVATVTAALPGGSGDAELFVAGSEGYVFGIPRKNGSAPGEIVFTLPILEEPKSGGVAAIAYTLVSGGASVSGDFRLP
ncbi:protein-disulfide reductase DsbD domain-containing protein [Aquibium sp. LZ166]|uniref:Protein-disulfide reductase DsbD domain-containing protein n=1 Tax=Aquibium pacificus TaxID=3153579 RepID=A0ABV3SQF7_9HYPH